jgi:quinol monooxygenase YgiN
MASVIVITPFEVPKGEELEVLATWDRFAEYFRRQPGHVSSRLHRAVDNDARFRLVAIAEWESADHYVTALHNPELQQIAEATAGAATSYPGIYDLIRD